MAITWHGHACFEVRTATGFTIGFDPHDGASLGISPPRFKADLVLISHEHFDHNKAEVIAKPGAKVLRAFIGEAVVGEAKVVGLRSAHDEAGGALRGPNTIYVVEVEGLRIAHLGDIGAYPSSDVMEALRGLDVMMIPVGGRFTLSPRDAWRLTEDLSPRITIPMHYKTPRLRLPIAPLDDYLKYVKFRVRRVEASSLEVSKDALPASPEVVVLLPP